MDVFTLSTHLALAAAAALVFACTRPTRRYQAMPFLLSSAEPTFHRRLTHAVGHHSAIFAKVRIADVLTVRHGIRSQRDWKAFTRVSSKHVDFVLCRPQDLRILAAIELDDRSHEAAERIARDRFVDRAFASASVPRIRIPLRCDLSVASLQWTIRTRLEPGAHSSPNPWHRS